MATNHLTANAIALVTIAFLGGCAHTSAHQNFVNIMEGNVSRPADDPYVYRLRNRNLRFNSTHLANGNIEEEFKAGRGPTCQLFFEVNESANRIVGWRYQGTKDDCAIYP